MNTNFASPNNNVKPITINGVHYPNIAMAARINDLNPGTLYDRIRRGCPENKLLDPANSHHPGTRKIRCLDTGKEYISANEAARSEHISSSAVSAAARGEQRTAGGWRWEYIE